MARVIYAKCDTFSDRPRIKPCKGHSTVVTSVEFDSKRRAVDLVERMYCAENEHAHRPLDLMLQRQNLALVHEDSVPHICKFFDRIQRHRFTASCIRGIAYSRGVWATRVTSEESLMARKATRKGVKAVVVKFCEKIHLHEFLGTRNVQTLAEAVSCCVLWPRNFPLTRHPPQLKVREMPWLRKLRSNTSDVNVSHLRWAIRDWCCVFFTKVLLQVIRMAYTPVIANRSSTLVMYAHPIHARLKQLAFEAYARGSDSKRLELLPNCTQTVARLMWVVVEGKKTRNLCKLTDPEYKVHEQRLNAALRLCLPDTKNHMRLCKKLLRDVREKIGDAKPLILQTDITRCFDNIHCRKLVEIVVQAVLKKYKEEKVEYIFVCECRTRNRTIFGAAFEYSKAKHILRRKMAAADLTSKQDPVVLKFTSKNLIESIKATLRIPILYDGQKYEQIRGIPQGASLASSLCQLYVVEMLKNVLPMIESLTCVHVLHYVDDLLIIGTQLKVMVLAARNFLEGSIGLKVCALAQSPLAQSSTSKTMTNFDVPGFELQKVDSFFWTSWEIDAKTLRVRPYRRLAIERLQTQQRFSRYKAVRKLAHALLKSPYLHRLPKTSTELLRPVNLLQLKQIATPLLPPAQIRYFFGKLMKKERRERRRARRQREHLGLADVFPRIQKQPFVPI